VLDSSRSPDRHSATAIPPQQILALNDAEDSENRIHSDAVAAKYGFKGALVSGVNVFGYLTQPLVRVYGSDFLEHGIMDAVFLKPAYQDNLISIRTENLGAETSRRNHLTCAYNEDEQLLAKLESWSPGELPPVNPMANLSAFATESAKQRPEISWQSIQVMTPAPIFLWHPSEAENLAHVLLQRDQSPVYKGSSGFLHPYYLLDACNKTLMRQFTMPAWIHTGSHLIVRKALRAGHNIEIRCLPMEKWEHRGHQYIKLYIAMLESDEVALEVYHTAIFRIAS
jgi:acyl dehydratase